MLNRLLRFEGWYHSRQLSFRAAAGLFFLFGLIAVRGGFGGDAVFTNAPYVVNALVALLSLLSILVSTLLCANVVLRDTTYRMDALVATSSVRRFSYFTSRFSGLFLAVFSLLGLAVLGLFVGSFLSDPARRGPVHLAFYAWPMLVFGVPNLFFSISLIFSTALLSRSPRAVYTTGVLIYVLYLLGSVLGNSPLMAGSAPRADSTSLLPFLMDPFGLAPFFQETRFWTVEQRNHQLFPVNGLFGINRLVWSGLALLVLAVSYRGFSFGETKPVRSRKTKPESSIGPRILYRRYHLTPGTLRHTAMAFGAQLKSEARAVFGNFPVWVMLILWVFLTGIDLKDHLRNGWFGIVTYPDTGVIVEYLCSIRPALLLIIFWGAELVGRERLGQRQALIASTPAHPLVFVGAKLAALALLIGLIISINIGIGLTIQGMAGYLEPGVLLYGSLYYYSGLPLLWFAVLVVFIQTLSPNKYLGLLLSLVVAALLVFSRRLGIEHYLLRYAVVPELNYSLMNGFGHYAPAFNWYMAYWGCCAVLLTILSVGFWPTTLHVRARHRLKTVGKQVGKTGRILFGGAFLLGLLVGGLIYYQTNVIGKYQSKATRQNWQIRYEQTYKRFAKLPQPVITALKMQVDVYPERRQYRVKGRYQLQNQSKTPLKRIWLGVDPEVSAVRLTLPGGQKKTYDPVFHQYQFELAKPLRPGETTSLHFSMAVLRTGFMPFNSENSVVENGSYIELEKYVPFLGYNTRLESDDETVRRAADLGRQTVRNPSDHYHRIDLETTISTAADQQIATVGTLQKSWIQGDRRYFSYQSSHPVPFMFALSSARYAEKTDVYQGVALRILYQPGQTANIPAMMQGLKDALAYGIHHFGPYPFRHLTLAEIPQYGGSATAYPGTVFSREKLNFLTDFREPRKVNYAYATVVHEVAHQWWAHQLRPVSGPGDQLLTESLAKYTEATVLRKRYGKMILRPYFQGDKNFYFASRHQSEAELPLVVTENQPFAGYQKGGLVLCRIQEQMGEEHFNRALRQLLTDHTYPRKKPKPDDLVQALKREATEEQRRLIDEVLRSVVTNALSIRVLSCKSLANRQFALTLEVNLAKTEPGNGGKPVVLPPDDAWEIAVFDQPSDEWTAATKPVYSRKYRFAKPRTIVQLTIAKKPKAVAIDPYGYALDENSQNNVADINE
ncbi:ABC transporter permease/M1 family aminopeptidase [Larkinella humicola]|uniref:M1 family metallopeptidase n=1 Tax=Larkinella humicola TaxID=2607654 RepID=A0A5N1JCM7_9BACT|nr:M1 family aminopeptidase [Larkinella humicola]KAA9346710.1 M1 family metallopeptidase [Larkinella humicola]